MSTWVARESYAGRPDADVIVLAILDEIHQGGVDPHPFVALIEQLVRQARALMRKCDEKQLSARGRSVVFWAVAHGLWSLAHKGLPWRAQDDEAYRLAKVHQGDM